MTQPNYPTEDNAADHQGKYECQPMLPTSKGFSQGSGHNDEESNSEDGIWGQVDLFYPLWVSFSEILKMIYCEDYLFVVLSLASLTIVFLAGVCVCVILFTSAYEFWNSITIIMQIT